MLQFHLLCICFVATAFAVPKNLLFEHIGHGDSLPRLEDDVSSPEVKLQYPIVFYNSIYDSIFVNSNGFLSFLTEVPRYYNVRFPLQYPLIAPFYADVDTRGVGSVTYWETQDRRTLDRAKDDIRKFFFEGQEFEPRSAFIVTWDQVGRYREKGDKKNSFQLVLVTDTVDSYVFLLYVEGGLGWSRGTGKDSGRKDALAQVGIMAGDHRYYELPSSGTNQVKNLDKRSNIGLPGIWLFRIGQIGDLKVGHPNLNVDLLDIGPTDCSSGIAYCHNHATCVDYNPGFCCQCSPDLYYGNGINCLKKDEPLRVTGKVSGKVNGVKIDDEDLHGYVEPNYGRIYVAISRIEGKLGYSLQTLPSISDTLGWLFAIPSEGNENGFQMTGGLFNSTIEVRFPETGHSIFAEQIFKGLDVYDNLEMTMLVKGSVPDMSTDTKLEMKAAKAQLSATQPGVLRTSYKRAFTMGEEDVETIIETDVTISYEPCIFEGLNVNPIMHKIKTNIVTYAEADTIIRFATTNKVVGLTDDPCVEGRDKCGMHSSCVIEDDNYRCICDRGFHQTFDPSTPDQPFCVDTDECAIGRNNCHRDAVCINVEGSYNCRCQAGFIGDGYSCETEKTCTTLECHQHAECIEDGARTVFCRCLPGYSGDGYRCEPFIDPEYQYPIGDNEIECRTHSECGTTGQCQFDEVTRRFICKCLEGYVGDGVTCTKLDDDDQLDIRYCREDTECGPMGECRYDSSVGRHLCGCVAGYVRQGGACVEDFDENQVRCREEIDCGSFGRCVYNEGLNDYTCACNPGYHMVSRECVLSQTQSSHRACQSDRDCASTEQCRADDEYKVSTCHCRPGYVREGHQCIVERIQQHVCRSDGDCHVGESCRFEDSARHYVCVTLGTCATDADCGQYGACHYNNDKRKYVCTCQEGYRREGAHCVPGSVEGPCVGNNDCTEHAQCLFNPTRRRMMCACAPGYVASGTICQPSASSSDLCQSDRDCGAHGLCSYNEKKGRRVCSCASGATRQGSVCVPSPSSGLAIKLCRNNQDCGALSECVYSEEHRRDICQCFSGYILQGDTCVADYTISLNPCDYDEDCGPQEECVYSHSLKEYVCQCEPGYTMNDEHVCTQDNNRKDDCRTSDICSREASCQYNPSTSSYECQCHSGFQGNGLLCHPSASREVVQKQHIPEPICIFGLICTCPEGWFFDGKACGKTSNFVPPTVPEEAFEIHPLPNCIADDCECPSGYQYNHQSESCDVQKPQTSTHIDINSHSQHPRPDCFNGQCRCPNGYLYDSASDSCRQDYSYNKYSSTDQQKKPDEEEDDFVQRPLPDCYSGQCSCIRGYYYNANKNKCYPSPGYIHDTKGPGVPDGRPTPTCRADGICFCPNTYHFDGRYNICLTRLEYMNEVMLMGVEPPAPTCYGNGACFCPPGFLYDEFSRRCNPDMTGESQSPTGNPLFINRPPPTCYSDASCDCPEGYRYDVRRQICLTHSEYERIQPQTPRPGNTADPICYGDGTCVCVGNLHYYKEENVCLTREEYDLRESLSGRPSGHPRPDCYGDGRCVCPSGYEYFKDENTCLTRDEYAGRVGYTHIIKPKVTGPKPDCYGDGRCVCPTGYEYYRSENVCLTSDEYRQRVSYPDIHISEGAAGPKPDCYGDDRCVCPNGYEYYRYENVCLTLEDYHRRVSYTDIDIKPSQGPKPDCYGDDRCVCPTGYEYYRSEHTCLTLDEYRHRVSHPDIHAPESPDRARRPQPTCYGTDTCFCTDGYQYYREEHSCLTAGEFADKYNPSFTHQKSDNPYPTCHGDGSCSCPQGYHYYQEKNACLTIQEYQKETIIPTVPTRPGVHPPPACFRDGHCSCPSGYHYYREESTCLTLKEFQRKTITPGRPQSPQGRPYPSCQADGLCTCPPGYQYYREQNACLTHSEYQRRDQTQSKATDYTDHPFPSCFDDGTCICPLGYHYNKEDDTCLTSKDYETKISTPTSPPPPSCYPDGHCLCTHSYRYYKKENICLTQTDFERRYLKEFGTSSGPVPTCREDGVCQCSQGFYYYKEDAVCLRYDDYVNKVKLSGGQIEFGCDDFNYCSPNAQCAFNAAKAKFTCICNTGFAGDGIQCAEVDKQACDNCSPYADCLLDPKSQSYKCVCRKDYDGDGELCYSRVNCENNPDACHPSAQCIRGRYGSADSCKCDEGYLGDGFLCEKIPEFESGVLAVSQGIAVLKVNVDNNEIDPGKPISMKGHQRAIAIGVDCITGAIYFSDIRGKAINKAKLDGSNTEPFLSQDMISPEGIVIDHSSRNIYWTDSEKDVIEVANLDTKHRKVLMNDSISNPRGMAINFVEMRLYWSDWQRDRPRIESSYLDGSSRSVFIEEDIGLPNALVINQLLQQICWADAGKQRIECMNLRNKERIILSEAIKPFGLTASETHLFWTDTEGPHKHIIMKVDKNSMEKERLKTPLGGSQKFYDLVYVPKVCDYVYSYCSQDNGGCHPYQLCVPDGRRYRKCLCPDNLNSTITCIES